MSHIYIMVLAPQLPVCLSNSIKHDQLDFKKKKKYVSLYEFGIECMCVLLVLMCVCLCVPVGTIFVDV